MDLSKQKCKTQIIEDLPSNNDELFEGGVGPHKRVANTIAGIISENNDTGGKVIGLEGGWGAGKSTVTKLVEQELSTNSGISYFYFDAWAHEGDPLRRTFLESIIRHFISINWVKESIWIDKIDRLAQRKKSTTTKTSSRTTTLGRIFAISLLFVPIGGPFLLSALNTGVLLYGGPPSWHFIIGIILMTSPLLVLLGNQLRIWINRRSNNEWAFLTGNSTTRSIQDSTELPEPTSIEFEDKFTELMSEALGSGKRQALVVFDNLDRIDPKFAITIWSTLQTFLQDRSTKKESWFKRLWILIPYDPDGLKSLWESNYHQTHKGIGSNITPDFVANSFIDKRFQIRFGVPPLVLSNWKSYLIKLLCEALPDHSKEEETLNRIFLVFNLARTETSRSPTPRELKLFVNQIGAIHRQWEHEFPLPHVAYFALLQRQRVNVGDELISGKVPSKTMESLLGKDLKANLAGLAFNVKNTMGQQLLLKDPIVKALSNNEHTVLSEYCRNHDRGFWIVLEPIVSSDFPDFDISTFSTAVSCINNSHIIKEAPNYFEIASIKEGIKKIALGKSQWGTFDKTITNGIKDLCTLIDKKDFTVDLVSKVRTSLSNIEFKADESSSIEITEGFIQIIETCISLKHQEALNAQFAVPVDQSNWIKLCSTFHEKGDEIWKLLCPIVGSDEITDLLSNEVSEGKFTENDLHAISKTKISFNSNVDWVKLVESLSGRLQHNQNVDSPEIIYLLKAFYLLKGINVETTSEYLLKLVNEGHILHHLYKINNQGNNESIAYCIATQLQFRPTGKPASDIGNSSAGYSLLEKKLKEDDEVQAREIISIWVANHSLSTLIPIVDSIGFEPMLTRCLKIVADSEYANLLFSTEIILVKWIDFLKHLNDEAKPNRFEQLIHSLCSNGHFIQELTSKQFEIDNCRLYEISLKNSSNSLSLQEWCKRGLSSLNKTTWQNQLETEGAALHLLISIMQVNASINLKNDFEDALVFHAQKIIKGEIKLSRELQPKWTLVIESLNAPEKQALPGRLLSEIMEMNGQISDNFFDLYGNEIANGDTLTKHRSVLERLFSPIVREKPLGGLKWLNQVVTNNPKILESFDKNHVAYFRDRLSSEISIQNPESEDSFNILLQIANNLGVSPKEESKD